MAQVKKKSTPYQTAHKIHRDETCGVVYQDWSGYGSSEEIEESEGEYKIRCSEWTRKDTLITDRKTGDSNSQLQQRKVKRSTHRSKRVTLKTGNGICLVAMTLNTGAQQEPLRIDRGENNAPLKIATTEDGSDFDGTWTVKVTAKVEIVDIGSKHARFLHFKNAPGSRFPLNPRRNGETTYVYKRFKGDIHNMAFELPQVVFTPPYNS